MKIKIAFAHLLEVTILIVGILSMAGLQAQSSSLPQRIMINPMPMAHKGVAITWRTENTGTGQFIQWSAAHSHPVQDMSIYQKKEAGIQVDTVTYLDHTSIVTSCHVTLPGLSPGSTYMYRVGSDEGGWSEWIQFELPASDPDSLLTFIYLGDPQNDLRSQWSRTIREAYATAPEADFILYAGDLVNKGYSDDEWGEWFEAGSFIHKMVPSIMTPGNHEYTDVILTPLWRSQFTLPENGPEGIKELYDACYYVDYPNLRVISLDGEQIDEDPRMRQAMAGWLEQVLEDTWQRWVVITTHYPFYNSKSDRNNPKLRNAFKSIVDQYGVDLILQGHDHGYGRGMLDEAANGPVNRGTMYVVSVSGPKMYDVGHAKWMARRGENVQLYQVIRIKGDRLYYKSYTTDGVLFDAFTLENLEKGSRLVSQMAEP